MPLLLSFLFFNFANRSFMDVSILANFRYQIRFLFYSTFLVGSSLCRIVNDTVAGYTYVH